MPESHARAFLDALATLEHDGDAGPLAELYAPDGSSQNLTATADFIGPDGARTFWSQDRKLFDSVASEFRSVIEDGDTVALEWTRSGTARTGRAVTYDGVSMITFTDGRITRFRAYYDINALGDQAT